MQNASTSLCLPSSEKTNPRDADMSRTQNSRDAMRGNEVNDRLRIIKCKANELYFQNFSHTNQSNRKTLDSTYTMHSNNSHPLTFNYFRTVNQPLMHFKVLAWLKGKFQRTKMVPVFWFQNQHRDLSKKKGGVGHSSRSIGSVEDVGGGDAPVFLFRLLLLNAGSTVLVGDAALVA
ncbi:unnamed protein product [Microthlaspi erraticum]|uniref:Uncharacterized protein n=1 Tax=Microthlaspi erraticum TaxID=1685480 RepID=A0A6D2HKA6_9BRAS|nr:unnamed protein product [Microthlaspi erraticum]